MGAIAPPLEGQKIFLNVSENKSGDRKLIFIFWCSRKKTLLTLDRMHKYRSFWGTSPPDSQRELCWAHSPQTPASPPQHELLDPPLKMRPIVADAPCHPRSVCLSVCLSICLLDTAVSPAKTAEPIESPFCVWTQVDSQNHALDGSPDPRTGRSTFGEILGRFRTCRRSTYSTYSTIFAGWRQ